MGSNRQALKSGMIYAVTSMINAGLVFLTTPYFTRNMEKTAYGNYNNFLSWYNILSVLSLNLYASFMSARRDYKETYNSYITSMCALNFFSLSLFLLIIICGQNFFLNILGIGMPYILLMFAYIAFYQLFMIYQVNERFEYRYKIPAFLNIFSSILTAFLSIVLVAKLSDQFMGKIIGWSVPTIIVGIISGVLIARKGGKINLSYWKYALPICIPYIPHLLSLNILNSLDKTMITSMVGSAETAVYSVAYTCGSIVSLVVGVLNNAYAPWMTNKLDENSLCEVQSFSRFYVIAFQIILCGILLFSPELVYILGGTEYLDAIYLMPAIIIGCSMQLIYTMYVNIEQYSMKTGHMATVSIFAALLNAILNYIFIPIYGYKVAAITTLISYLILALGHICVVKNIGFTNIYNTKINIMIILCDVFAVPTFHIIYKHNALRILLIIIYICFGILIWINRKKLLDDIFKKGQNK